VSPLRILVLAPWPFREPRHGGQLRGAAVVQAYRDAGHRVYSAGLYDAGVKPGDVWAWDLPLLPGAREITQAAVANGHTSEMIFWVAVANAADSFAAFKHTLLRARPHILQFEEPFLWPVVRRLRAEGLLDRVAVVHSSYNFETEAWQYRSVPGVTVNSDTLRDIAALEQDVARSCDLIITVSEIDAGQFRALGAKRVCVAANGVARLSRGDPSARNAYLPSDRSYVLFVSSAHPPNARGLVDWAAAARGHPLRHGEILICGQVGSLVRSASNFQTARRILDRSRFLGWVDKRILDTLYAGARAVILPKTLPGGSNLKTAEALASGRPVVATSRAFDGFESFRDLPGITIADDPDIFWTVVNDLLARPAADIARPLVEMENLLWRECLKPMVRAAEDAAFEVGSQEVMRRPFAQSEVAQIIGSQQAKIASG
jgi:glycosyltransferase involved in cell wall biosynthesis